MKKFLCLIFACAFFSMNAQEKVYNPNADAKKDLAEAISKAKKENKHVFVQVGGNWCPWCIRFHQFIEDDAEIKKMINDNYVVVKVNYDPKTQSNKEVLKGLDYPQRFGFPVFVILDKNGKRIHTQNSGYLESCEGKGYNEKNVLSFFKHWTPSAVDPNAYK